jgi:hypothetical protein
MLALRRAARIKEVLKNICQQRIMRRFRNKVSKHGYSIDKRLKNYIRKYAILY